MTPGPVIVGLYDDYAHEVLVSTKARALNLGIIQGHRGDSVSHRGGNDYLFRIPTVLEALARDFISGAFDHTSPYDPVLREIHRTTHALASWLIIMEGVYGTHISRVGPPDFLSSSFMPDYLITSARGIRAALLQRSQLK
jgi:hypothetical protein